MYAYRCARTPVMVKKKTGKQELCKYLPRICSLPVLENYDYCIKHILEDKSAPYKPCGFVYSVNGKKCTQPALKGDRKEGGFCAEHARKCQLTRQRAGGRNCPPQTAENLLSSLSHYVPCSRIPCDEIESDNNGLTAATCHPVDPFAEIDANKVNLCSSKVLDYVSESDSDVEPATLDNVWRDADRDSSDAESVDSQQEDPLKHAGIYTAEEVTVIVKDKMCRLQTLYIDQFKRLQHVLKERKRKYYHSLLKEKETLSSIHDQSKTSAKEMKLYEKLKALNRFHKRSGQEGVLYMRVREKRNQNKKMKKLRHRRNLEGKGEGLSLNPAPICKCIFTEGGVKCGLKTIPSSKFCRKHILQDPHQVLFRPCGCEKADVLCQEPTLDVFENASCPLHILLPPLPFSNLENSEVDEPKLEEEDIKLDTEDNVKKDVETNSELDADVNTVEKSVDRCSASTASEQQKDPNKDSVVDEIMADVDVVEEVIMSQDTGQPIKSENENIRMQEAMSIPETSSVIGANEEMITSNNNDKQ